MWIAFTFFNTAGVYYITNLLALGDVWVTIVSVISIAVGVATYPLVNILARKVGKKPMLLGACITHVLLYFANKLSSSPVRCCWAPARTAIRYTALVAMIFVALSVVIYCFYHDKEITRVLRCRWLS